MEGERIMMRRVKIWTLLLFIPLLVVTGCGKKEESGSQPKEVRIGIIRVPNDKQVAISQNYFKEYFEDKGIKTKFMFFDSGVAANQAFSSNSIDFAEMGYTNGVVALSTGIPVELIWIHEVLGTNEALVVQKDGNIKDITALKGKKVATPFSSTSHFSLLRALNEAGITDDVTLLDMQTSEIVAAWDRGDIDGAYTWEPTLSTLKENGHVLIDSQEMADKGYLTANIDLVHQDFAKKYPELVEDYLLALNKGVKFYQEEPEKAAESTAKELSISKDDALNQMTGTTWLTLEDEISPDYLGTEKNPGAFNEVFFKTGEFLNKQGAIKDVPTKEQIQAFIQPKYIEQAIKKQ